MVEAIAAHDPDIPEALMKHRIHAITEVLRMTVWKMDGNGSSQSHTGGPHT